MTGVRDPVAKTLYVSFPGDRNKYFFEESDIKKWIIPGSEGSSEPPTTPSKHPPVAPPPKPAAEASGGHGKKRKASDDSEAGPSSPPKAKNLAEVKPPRPQKSVAKKHATPVPVRTRPSPAVASANSKAELIQTLKDLAHKLTADELRSIVQHATEVAESK